ncbi:hypothetical protein OC861_001769 [Tilletia horrida]|nr:hypothetical protein OC861_001769 [Tilletia horrida]
MDFTDTHPHSSSANLCYSPGSSFLAYITGDSSNSVIVCRSDTLQIANQWDFGEYGIQQLQWSDDGLFLHATNLIHGIIFVLSPDPQRRVSDGSDDDEGWLARLESGYEGMAAVTWAPVAGPPVVLAFSMHQLRFTAYDLANQGVTIFQNPKKAKILRAIKLPSIFSVLEVHNEIDHISIYRFKPHTGLRPSADEVSGWVTDHSFPIATNDAQEVSWAPDGNHFAVSENILEYKVVVYTLSGSLRATLGPEGPDGTHISVTIPSLATSQGSRTAAIKGRSAKGKAKDEVEEPSVASGGLGVRCMAWHPSGQMLAIGGYDEHLRILESEFWGLWSSLDISTRVIDHGDNTSPQLFMPLSGPRTLTEQAAIKDQESSLPVTLQHVRPDFSKPNPKAGILWMEWNEDGTLLACRNGE